MYIYSTDYYIEQLRGNLLMAHKESGQKKAKTKTINIPYYSIRYS